MRCSSEDKDSTDGSIGRRQRYPLFILSNERRNQSGFGDRKIQNISNFGNPVWVSTGVGKTEDQQCLQGASTRVADAGDSGKEAGVNGLDSTGTALRLPASEINGRFPFVGTVVADPEFALLPDEAGVAGIPV